MAGAGGSHGSRTKYASESENNVAQEIHQRIDRRRPDAEPAPAPHRRGSDAPPHRLSWQQNRSHLLRSQQAAPPSTDIASKERCSILILRSEIQHPEVLSPRRALRLLPEEYPPPRPEPTVGSPPEEWQHPNRQSCPHAFPLPSCDIQGARPQRRWCRPGGKVSWNSNGRANDALLCFARPWNLNW